LRAPLEPGEWFTSVKRTPYWRPASGALFRVGAARLKSSTATRGNVSSTKKKKRGTKIVHLTMYGLPYKRVLQSVKGKRLLVVIGSKKVPRGIYGEANYNCSITNQPHSEAGALAVFLEGLGLQSRFRGAKLRLKPSARGKRFTTKYK